MATPVSADVKLPLDTVAPTQTDGNWQLHFYPEVASTNLVAAQLPPWHAVRAVTQSAGRGRFQRTWVSDEGGLWLSAVLPFEPKAPAARLLPLAAGLAVCDALRQFGATDLRLRWPNDILVGERKLAGLLIDQMTPGLAVVGIGVNVANRPETGAPELRGLVARLADLVSPAPSLDTLTGAVLSSLGNVWRQVQTAGPDVILPRINALWGPPSHVQLDLDGQFVAGHFDGVDSVGRLRLRSNEGQTQLFEPHEVRLLREIPLTP